MVVERCLDVRALLTRLITRFQVSTYYITHNANGYECHSCGRARGYYSSTGECKQDKVGREGWIIRSTECLYSMCVCICVCFSVCVCVCVCVYVCVYEGMRGVCVEMTQA